MVLVGVMSKKIVNIFFAIQIQNIIFVASKIPKNITIMSKESLIKLRDHILETLSYEERAWLVDELNQVDDEKDGICPYTKEELDARFDELESDFEKGDYLPADETFRLIAQDLGFENRMERIAV